MIIIIIIIIIIGFMAEGLVECFMDKILGQMETFLYILTF